MAIRDMRISLAQRDRTDSPSAQRRVVDTGGNPFGPGHKWVRSIKSEKRWTRRANAEDGFVHRLGRVQLDPERFGTYIMPGGMEYRAPSRAAAEEAHAAYLIAEAKRRAKRAKRAKRNRK